MITRENFRAALQKAVEDRGEGWVYPDNAEWRAPNHIGETYACLYVKADGLPACLIGYAVHAIDPEGFAHKMGGREKPLIVRADQFLHLFGVKDEGLMGAAMDAQDAQDQGYSWGEAVAKFDRTMGVYA